MTRKRKAVVEIVEWGMEFRIVDEIPFNRLHEAVRFVDEENRLLDGTIQSARIKAGCEKERLK